MSPNYDESCRNAAKLGEWSSAWTIMAAATVIGCPIHSVYPTMNGILDSCVGILNHVFYPAGSKSSKSEPIKILWTSTTLANRNTWVPNHFVPLILKSSEVSIIDLDSFSEFPPLNSTKLNDTNSCPTIFDTTCNSVIGNPQSDIEGTLPCKTEPSFSALETQSELEGNPSIHAEEAFTRDASFSVESSQSQPEGNLSVDIERKSDTDDCDSSQSHPEGNPPVETETKTETGIHRLMNGFLSVEEVLYQLENATHVLPDIPRGKKENVFFVSDNSKNIEKRSLAKKMDFWDDCGVWDTKTTSKKTQYYLKTSHGSLTFCHKKNGLFGKLVKKEFVPFEPQPNISDIFTIKRYYATLKRDVNYKKRVSFFETGVSSKIQNLAVAEYIGKFPADETSVHGNSSKNSQEYVRASPATKTKVHFEIDNGKSVRQIFADNFLADEHQPRDSKFIENMKYNINKENNPGSKRNPADDVQNVISLLSLGSKFIKEIIQTAGKPPNIICYTDFQLKHFGNALKTSVIGVDRTFNLGSCFVTTTVFQEKKLVRKGTQTNPIILGPIYLHWDGCYHTYQRFFTHLASVLEDSFEETKLSLNDLVFGTDEEKALVKAITNSFPKSKLTLCTRHLAENFKRYLKNKIGMNEKISKEIFDDVFGPFGLAEADTTVDFTEKANEIEYKHKEKLGIYLTEKVIPCLQKYVCSIRNNDEKVPLNWKNNNCESLNHILKLNQNWTPQKLPELIEKIEKECLLQEALVRGAIYGHGNFCLQNWLSKLQCNKIQWQSKSQFEKDSLVYKFLNFGNKKKEDKMVKSSDGKLVIPRVNKIASKPCQRKRAKSEKTYTCRKKVRTE